MTIVKLDVSGDARGADPGGDAELVELKQRAAAALERAFGFLEREAGRVELDRARVLMGVDGVDAWLAGVEARREGQGAWPTQGVFAGGGTGAGDLEGLAPPPSLAGAFESLLVLADAKALERPCVEALGLHLLACQCGDGSFGDDATPEPMRLFMTGMIAGLLGQTTHVRPDLLHAAAAWLAPRFSPEAVEGGRWSAITAFGTFFSNVGHDDSDAALQWCGRELERGYRTGRFDASATVRALLYCDALAMPGAQLDPLELLDRMLGEQAADGGFAELSPGGVRARVNPTVDAMHGLVSLCRRF